MNTRTTLFVLLAGCSALTAAFLATRTYGQEQTAAYSPTGTLTVQMDRASSEQAERPIRQMAQARPDRPPPPRDPRGGRRGGGTPDGKRKPSMSDTLRANIYADNTFELYINGRLTAVDSIEFIPHNVISVDILPEYPMTIAVKAMDNADPRTGTEYGSSIGDGGFILKIGDRIVTNGEWKAQPVFHGPVNGDVKNPQVRHAQAPPNWMMPSYDDSRWPRATVFSENEIRPKNPYYQNDFRGAQWIWSKDLKLDNTVLFRATFNGPSADFYTGR